jgi:hypothetical protein
VIGPDGRLWWTTSQATRQLRVESQRLRDWVRRSGEAGHVARQGRAECPACHRRVPARFPHVDPPVRVGRFAAYLAEQLLGAEEYTATSTRTGKIRRGA